MQNSRVGGKLIQTPSVFVVVPVYNGSFYLESCVSQLRSYFASRQLSYELIIAEDGSTDGSKALCRDLLTRFPDIRLLEASERLGRGESLRRAIQLAEAEIGLYTDVDMATDLTYMDDLIARVSDGEDIVTASRYLPESASQRVLPRLIASRVYNRLVRLLLGSQVTDHQCGFKAFKRKAILELLPTVKADHWFWDTEILVRAQLAGFRVGEVPVHWSEGPAEKSTVRLLRDSIRFMSELVRLKLELRES